MFICLFNDADLKVQTIYRRMRNGNIIMISKLAKDVRESIVANTNYGISMQVQRKTMGNLIQGSRFHDRDVKRNELVLNQERFP
jgi:hypothetical protein